MNRRNSLMLATAMAFSFCLTAWLTAQDRKLAEPDMKVFVDNDYVRVQEHSLKSGQQAAMHSHPCYIIYTTPRRDRSLHPPRWLDARGIG